MYRSFKGRKFKYQFKNWQCYAGVTAAVSAIFLAGAIVTIAEHQQAQKTNQRQSLVAAATVGIGVTALPWALMAIIGLRTGDLRLMETKSEMLDRMYSLPSAKEKTQ